MDGRPHPPEYAPHSWMGFSTGRFVGNALEVRTTHLKQGWYRRNGTPESDQATLVEFFVRHGDRLTHTVVVTDPVYLEEPLVTTTDFYRQPTDHQNWLFPCDDGEQATVDADVDAWLQNHPLMVPFQGWLTRLSSRGLNDMNPFVVGRSEYQKFLDVIDGCSRIALARRGL